MYPPDDIRYMHSPDDIHYLRRQDIDTAKWDAAIHLIYGKSYYLDHMTDGQWDALIAGDYKIVMPLTWRRKWGITYLYQPAFTQQLGLFSTDPIPWHKTNAFLKECGRHFKFSEIFLNYRNPTPGLKSCTKLVLGLNASYEHLAASYKRDLLNNLKNAGSLHYVHGPDLAHALSLFRELYSHRLPHLSSGDFDRFGQLCSALEKKGQLVHRAVTDNNGQLLATALLPRDGDRIYLLQSTVSTAGRLLGANHFLLDRLIFTLARQRLTLDFEGSEQPGIAHFYRNFGAKDQPYFFYRNNHLPWPLRYLKPPPRTRSQHGD
ncbi:MAG TPA: GNAT family N-acetyltransferase [Puia sp.]